MSRVMLSLGAFARLDDSANRSARSWRGRRAEFVNKAKTRLASRFLDRVLLYAQQLRLVGVGQRGGDRAVLAVLVREVADQVDRGGAGGLKAAFETLAAHNMNSVVVAARADEFLQCLRKRKGVGVVVHAGRLQRLAPCSGLGRRRDGEIA